MKASLIGVGLGAALIFAIAMIAPHAHAQSYSFDQQQALNNLSNQLQYQSNMNMLNNLNTQLQQTNQAQQQQMLNLIPRYCYGFNCR